VNSPPKPPNDEPGLAPVFLVGCPRSGTTLLQRLLDAHPQVAIAPETHFIRRFWMRRDSYGDLTDDGAFARLVSDIIAMPEFPEMALDAEAFRAAARTSTRTYSTLFELLLRSFARRRGAAIAGEKTPNHLLYMQTLERFFPAARFIHIVRDPRAVVNSWMTVPWSTGTIAGDTGVWRRYVRTAWKQPPRRGALKVVHYEVLAAAPEKVLRSICEFLGLPFHPAMLEFHEREPDTLNFSREPWKRKAAGPIDDAAIEDWRQRMSAGHIEQIEQLAWREMLRLGYKPLTGTPALVLATARRVVRNVLVRARARLTRRTAAGC
jgi:LPS sulfotransferase NodH